MHSVHSVRTCDRLIDPHFRARPRYSEDRNARKRVTRTPISRARSASSFRLSASGIIYPATFLSAIDRSRGMRGICLFSSTSRVQQRGREKARKDSKGVYACCRKSSDARRGESHSLRVASRMRSVRIGRTRLISTGPTGKMHKNASDARLWVTARRVLIESWIILAF